MTQENELVALLDKILRDRGFDARRYKVNFLKRRLSVRMRAREAASYGEYLALLDADPEEYPQLMSALTISLSYFFRDGEVFLSIRDSILSPLIERRNETGHRHLAVWSAGCAGGEEPYSVAILVWELLGSDLDKWRVQILATDIDDAALCKAREARFTDFSFRGVSDEFLSPCFIRQAGFHEIRPEFKPLVTFCHHDLTAGDLPDAGLFDVILCRNVLIYFTREQQAKVLTALHRALRPGGHLVLGMTETPLAVTEPLFRVENPRLHIYTKEVLR